MCRIGGRLRSWYVSVGGVDVEIPPFVNLDFNWVIRILCGG